MMEDKNEDKNEEARIFNDENKTFYCQNAGTGSSREELERNDSVESLQLLHWSNVKVTLNWSYFK